MEASPHSPGAPHKPTAETVEARMKIAVRDIGIPPRPTILSQIEQEAAKDEPDFLHLARLLSQDVGLSAGIIKVANSPFFSFRKKIPTVQEALLSMLALSKKRCWLKTTRLMKLKTKKKPTLRLRSRRLPLNELCNVALSLSL